MTLTIEEVPPTRVAWRNRSPIARLPRLWRTRSPRTFREKVRYKMVRDRRQLLVTFADKAAVRDYVARAVGEHYLPRAVGVVSDAEHLRALDLPREYVVKPTHGSGAAIVVSESAPADAVLPTDLGSWAYAHVRPDSVAIEDLVRLSRGWIPQLYGRGPNREWAYSQVTPAIIVEEFLQGVDGAVPDDLKLFVFHGRVRYIQVDSGRFGRRTQDFFLPDWEHLPLSGGPPWAEPAHPRPERLEEMIAVAEALGSETDFVRVDLYDLGDRLVFGELTSYPAGGDSPFHPESFDEEFGAHWTVPRRYR